MIALHQIDTKWKIYVVGSFLVIYHYNSVKRGFITVAWWKRLFVITRAMMLWKVNWWIIITNVARMRTYSGMCLLRGIVHTNIDQKHVFVHTKMKEHWHTNSDYFNYSWINCTDPYMHVWVIRLYISRQHSAPKWCRSVGIAVKRDVTDISRLVFTF